MVFTTLGMLIFTFMIIYYEKPFLPLHEIYVFGSNLQGVHGAGAALVARRYYKAKLGVGSGMTGRAYAIPTRSYDNGVVTSLQLRDIVPYIHEFVQFTQNKHMRFYVTKVGLGYAGFTVDEIAPHFKGASNCLMPICFKPYLESN